MDGHLSFERKVTLLPDVGTAFTCLSSLGRQACLICQHPYVFPLVTHPMFPPVPFFLFFLFSSGVGSRDFLDGLILSFPLWSL